MKPKDIPNIISIIRILLVGPTVYLLLKQEYALAFFLFGVAGASDALDGFLAKRYHWQSELGAMLDPMGDKLLLVSCYLVLGWLGHLPLLLVALVIARDLIIVFGALGYHLLIAKVKIETVYISRINTAMQMLLVVLVIFSLTALPLSQVVTAQILEVLIITVYLTTILSGTAYILQWGKRALAVKRQEGNHD